MAEATTASEPAPVDEIDVRALVGPRRYLIVRRPGRRFAGAVVLVVLLAGNVAIGWNLRAAHQRQQQDIAAVGLARAVVTDYFTLSPATAAQWSTGLLARSTGNFKQQLTQYRGSVQSVLEQNPRTSVGTPIRAALVGRRGGTATVMVAVNSTVTAAGAKKPGATQFYRMRAVLDRRDDRWLVSALEVVPS